MAATGLTPRWGTLLHAFEHWERTQPEAVYLTQPIGEGPVIDYSWREVGSQARRMAAHLRSLDLPAGSRIAILGKNSAHWIVADLAIWFAGHVSVPLYPTLNAETARYILEHSGARLLFVGKMDELWAGVTGGIPAELPRIHLPLSPQTRGALDWDRAIAGREPLRDALGQGSADLATILYTSGSTGRPKGVMINFRAMVAAAEGVRELFAATPADRMLSYLPLAHAAERALVETGSLYYGYRLYFAWSLATFIGDLRRARPTLFFSVPRLWTRFYQGICAKLAPGLQRVLFSIPVVGSRLKRRVLTELGFEHVRVALTGSAPLAPVLVDWYRNLGLELLEGYALSENFSYSHASRPGRVRVGYVGSTNPAVDCRISAEGEIEVRSPTTMQGYYREPELTAAAITADGYLRTGDRGELDEQGRLKITGRVKDLFKTSKGKYVAPVPIETLLAHHPAIESVCVAGSGRPQPHALVVLAADARSSSSREALSAELASCLDQVNAQVESHEELAFLVVVKDPWTMDNGLLTPTLKVRRHVVEGRYESQAEGWAGNRQKVVWEA